MKKIWVLASLLALFLISCTKENSSYPSASIAGNWAWQYSVGGPSGNDSILPPDGLVVALELKSDNHYRVTADGQSQTDGTYQIIEVESIFTQMQRPALRLESQSGAQTWLITVQGDSLILSDNHVEPYHRYYLKIE